MPQGRVLKKKISKNETLPNLSREAILLYTWCIPHLDVSGKIYGNEEILKGTVVPYLKFMTKKVIARCVQELSSTHLVVLYGKEHKYLYFTGFSTENTSDKSKEAASVIPDPPQELVKSKSRVSQELVSLEVEEKRREEK